MEKVFERINDVLQSQLQDVLFPPSLGLAITSEAIETINRASAGVISGALTSLAPTVTSTALADLTSSVATKNAEVSEGEPSADTVQRLASDLAEFEEKFTAIRKVMETQQEALDLQVRMNKENEAAIEDLRHQLAMLSGTVERLFHTMSRGNPAP